MVAIFEPLFTKLNAHYLPISAFEPVAQPKQVKSITYEPMGSTKMFQKFETKVLTLSLGPSPQWSCGQVMAPKDTSVKI